MINWNRGLGGGVVMTWVIKTQTNPPHPNTTIPSPTDQSVHRMVFILVHWNKRQAVHRIASFEF